MSDENKEIAQNVIQFIGLASKYYGKAAEDRFNEEMLCNCDDLGMVSPIEQLLWVAVHLVCHVNFIDLNSEPITVNGKDQVGYGMHMSPQFKLANYRADFVAYCQRRNQEPQEWIIECDGHDFHERTKQERQYEKKRDRFFTVRGYKILRFTGSEIVKSPFDVAVEVISAVTGDDQVVIPQKLLEL